LKCNRIIAMLEKTGTLKIANVGDCGLKVIRKGEVDNIRTCQLVSDST
jgi:serine/threonine protein phosphatase PrpC